jgi:hypothetical protein
VNAGPWRDTTQHFTNNSGGWSPVTVPLSSFVDSIVQIAFLFHSEDNPNIGGPDVGPGWSIDDILISGIASCFSPNITSIQFGIVGRGQPKRDSITVSNPCGDTLRISSVLSRNGAFAVAPATANIPQGQSQRFYITFTPPRSGFYDSRIVFFHNGANGRDSIRVSGRAWDKIVWQGTTDNAWSNPQNWSRNDTVGAVPAPTDSVIIFGSRPNQPRKGPGFDAVGALNIDSSGILTLLPSASIVVNNTLFIGGSAQLQVQSSTVDSIGGDVILNGRFEVASTASPVIYSSRNWVRGAGSVFVPGNSIIPFVGSGFVSGNFNSVQVASPRTSSGNIAIGNRIEVRNNLSLRQNLGNLQTDTLFIQSSDSTVLFGDGFVETGTIKRAIQPGVAARYRFESDSTYIRLRAPVPGLTSITMTVLRNLSAINIGDTIVRIPTILDTVYNVLRTDSLFLQDRRQWVIVRPRPTLDPLLDTTAILRVYGITAEGATNFRVAATFRYDDAEIQRGVREGRLQLYWGRVITGVAPERTASIPEQYSLSQNYPNPFNPTTTIRYALPVQSTVSLKVYNILGQEVKALVNESQLSGNYAVLWDGKNNHGAQVSTGIYFYRLEVNGLGASNDSFTQVRKMILLK